jgi:hypothetical protein
MHSVKSVLLLAVALCACSNALEPGAIEGKWTEDFTVPGNSLEMNLTYAGGAISGTGNWCGEAAPCGTLVVAGTINENAVHLDLTFTTTLPPSSLPPSVQRFDGRFTALRSLRGTISAVTPGQPPVVLGEIGFHRP